jgi:hypothetical protein
MINSEDPHILLEMQKVAKERIESTFGISHKDNPVSTTVKMLSAKPSKKTIPSTKKSTFGDSPESLNQFLIEFGVPKEQIREAVAKVKSGKIKLPSRDYSWITTEVISDPNFDIKGVLSQMSEDRKNSINFKVGLDTLQKGKKSGD